MEALGHILVLLVSEHNVTRIGCAESNIVGGGDIFVGGAIPFGSVKVGIDTFEKNISYAQINGGWTPEGLVTGISMLHVSGTGASPKYGMIAQMPLTTVDPPVNVLDNTTYWQRRVGNDSASVGYYKTHLKNGVDIELSATHNAGIMQYHFPTGEKHVLVDVSHYIPNPTGGYASQTFQGGEISIQNATYTGHGIFGGGWNEGAPFPVYFCGEFEVPPDEVRTFRGPNTDPMARIQGLSTAPILQPMFQDVNEQISGWSNDRIGAVFTWSKEKAGYVRSKVGVSFVSTDKACRFKDEEIHSWHLNATVDAAVKKWNEEVFQKVRVPTEGPRVNETNLVLLYSSLYFMHFTPSERTNDNPFWESDEPYWDDFYTLWDLFRCTVSLYHLLQPSAYEGMIRALVDTWRHEGYMPDGRSGFWNGQAQGGSNADNVLADAYVKGLRGSINWTEAYQAMLKNAEVQPINTFSHDDESASVKEGRGALDDWLKVGYVSSTSTRAISRTVEYALNDYAVSVVAAGEAPHDVQKYLNRSAGWQKIWNEDVHSRGFKGFLAPKTLNGTWNLTNYDVLQCGVSDCGFLGYSFQTVPFECSFTLPMDMETLIQKMGGAKEFERRLDYIVSIGIHMEEDELTEQFIPGTSAMDLGVNGADITTIMNIGYE